MDNMALLNLANFTSLTFLSASDTAEICCAELEQMLIYHKKIEIDFSNVHVTQGFIQHLFEPLFLKRGMILFDRLFFANCSESVELTINEVITHCRETCQPMH